MSYSREATKPDWYFSHVITISSETGVGGTSTLSALYKHFASDGKVRRISGGEIFKEFARESGMTIGDFVRYCRLHPEELYDQKCDQTLAVYGSQNYTLIEGRLPHAFVPRGFHVLLTCDLATRAKRRQKDPEYSIFDVGIVSSMIRDRDEHDVHRFGRLYLGCLWKSSDFDLVVSTEIFTPEQVASYIVKRHEKWRGDNCNIINNKIT
ncbi:MAG: hypothetical protein ABL899_01340 [Nitrospira sp.]